MMRDASFFIAKRYFTFHDRKKSGKGAFRCLILFLLAWVSFSPKRIRDRWKQLLDAFIRQNFVRILSRISIIGVAIGTAAMVIVLSVFNGLEDLTRSMFRSYNPDLKITPSKGKSFVCDSLLLKQLSVIEGVAFVTEVIEDNALLRYHDRQKVVMLKGVSATFFNQYRLDTLVIKGEPVLYKGKMPHALLGAGVYYELSVNLRNDLEMMQAWYPRRDKKVSLNPENAFNQLSIFPGGVFSVEPQFDQQYVIVPIEFASELLQYGQRRTALEIKLVDKKQAHRIKNDIQKVLGTNFDVKTTEEQQATILRAIKIERLFVMMTFVFILGIASFNIFFSLAMLVVEKKKDLNMLYAMGADASFTKRIFYYEGALIAFSGTFLGLIVGWMVCYMQQQLELVTLGSENSFHTAYPVRMEITDFLLAGTTMLFVTMLASFFPASQAKRMATEQKP
ncbi:MAG: FtsX-like permease family protein [Flammeovirgaceae bacterium]|nr:FtsX-like permease family protein [Flammeovirgaceae bacterium]